MIEVDIDGAKISIPILARLLVEVSRGTSSYTLHRAYQANEWQKAVAAYQSLPSHDGAKKRLTAINNRKRQLLARAG